ncbi:Ribokinase-like protein [Spinellus fusiger]|nr:Ribokinase-like protein [Spinellus fusiger]
MTGPLYASMGSLIIDDIHYEDGSKQTNVLGGAGIYAIYGMRCWSIPAKSIAYVVHTGFDCPPAIDTQLQSLGISLSSHHHKDHHTPRGLNIFSANDHRDFTYVHPILHIHPADFPVAWIESIRVMHLITSSQRASDILREWQTMDNGTTRTDFIWEPVPWTCLPDQFSVMIEIARHMAVFTPNHEEAASMLGIDWLALAEEQGAHTAIETLALQLLAALYQDSASSVSVVVVLRASKYGSVVVSHQHPLTWVPAYWKDGDSTHSCHVKDVTGAGNAFCGGYAVGWGETRDAIQACCYGAVAASYAVEQVGVPICTDKEKGEWNHSDPYQRLAHLKKRINRE